MSKTKFEAFAILSVGLISVPCLYYCLCLYYQAPVYNPKYAWPQLTDLWKTVVSGLFFLAAKKAIVLVAVDPTRKICKD
jgi:hypothetical protein